MKLTKRDIKQWVKILRSGEYQQGKNWLCVDDEDGNPHFCCLGVACDIFLEGQWEPAKGESESHWLIENEPSFPPRELSCAIDEVLASDNPDENYACERLAEMNDEGMSFEEIADYIEKRAGLR